MYISKKMEEKIKKTRAKVTVSKIISIKDNLMEIGVGETRKYGLDDFVTDKMLEEIQSGKRTIEDVRRNIAGNIGKRAYDLKQMGREYYYHRDGDRMVFVTRVK